MYHIRFDGQLIMVIAKLFFLVFVVSAAIAEVPWMARFKRDIDPRIDQTTQCPASPIELSEMQWNM